MSANHASIKLSRELVEDARREAEVLHRSVGAQVEHWARLGRIFENTPGVDVSRVRDVLEGALKIEDLAGAEQNGLFRELGDHFNRPDATVEAYYAEVGAREGAVGTDEGGQVVRRMADGSLQRIR